MLTDDSIVSGGPNSNGLLPINSGEMPSDEDLETYRIVFELFDRDRSGYIDNHDLAAIAVKLGKEPEEVFSLVGNFDTNQDGKVSFGEFVQSLWHLHRMDDVKEHMAVSQSLRGRSNLNITTGHQINNNSSIMMRDSSLDHHQNLGEDNAVEYNS